MIYSIGPLLFLSLSSSVDAFSSFIPNNFQQSPLSLSSFQQQQKQWASRRTLIRQPPNHELYGSSSSTLEQSSGDTTITAAAAAAAAVNLEDAESTTAAIANNVQVFPAKEPLSSFLSSNDNDNDEEFSILSWNILLPNSNDNWWNHKMYSSHVPMEKRQWSHRRSLIRDKLLESNADIICIQEANGDTFHQDFDYLLNKDTGDYDYCLHKKFRFRCATFYKRNKFVLDQVAHKDRTLVTALKLKKKKKKKSSNNNHKTGDTAADRILNVVNCHLSGGAAPDRRLRQVHEGLDQIRKWKNKVTSTVQKQRKANRPNIKNVQKSEAMLKLHENAGVIVCGDFNSDGNTGVRRFLVDGRVEPDWREPQYPSIRLTSKLREHTSGWTFHDAAELAFGMNVCDGDYGENPITTTTTTTTSADAGDDDNDSSRISRPATYVVPNLASMLLLPVQGEGTPRTEFGHQMAKGIVDTLGMNSFSEDELDDAFDSIDLDGNDIIDEDEVEKLLETVYVKTYGMSEIEEERKKFFSGFGGVDANKNGCTGLTREQLKEKLTHLRQQLLEQGGQGRDSSSHHRVTKGIVDALGMKEFNEAEVDKAFDRIDLDGNQLLDETEVQRLLESVYVNTYGRHKIEKERKNFFHGFQKLSANDDDNHRGAGLSREQLKEKLVALQQQLEGGNEGVELVEINTDQDAQRMIDRFTPVLRDALDYVFDAFSSNGDTLSREEVEKFLIKTNEQLGRGGMWRHTESMFEQKAEASVPAVLSRQDWYAAFARELGEGKWWQVVYDLEVCGVNNLRSKANRNEKQNNEGQHYQGWLDYLYFDSQQLMCKGVQDALTPSELSLIYDEGDALPNEWHPSDHLPVSAVFSFDRQQ